MVTIDGMEVVKRALETKELQYRDALAAAQVMMGVAMIRDSLKNAPIATGELRRSAYVRFKRRTKALHTVTISYGARHAGAQHKGEITRNGQRIKLNPRIGSAGFLRKAVRARSGNYAAAIAAYTQYAFRASMTPEQVNNPYKYVPKKRTPRARKPKTGA